MSTADPVKLQRARLPDGQTVACLSPGEVGLVHAQIQGYFNDHDLALGPAPVVLDVGANIGVFALELCRRYPKAKVYAFEPIPSIHRALQHNAEALGGGRITPILAGLSDAPGEARFVFYPRSSVLSTRYPEGLEEDLHAAFKANVAAAPWHLRWVGWLPRGLRDGLMRRTAQLILKPEEVVCRLDTLSNALRAHDIERVDLLKIDAEKSELDVLMGVEDAHWPRIQSVVMEVHDIDGRLDRITSMLRARGFTRQHTSKEDKLEDLPIFSLHARRA